MRPFGLMSAFGLLRPFGFWKTKKIRPKKNLAGEKGGGVKTHNSTDLEKSTLVGFFTNHYA